MNPEIVAKWGGPEGLIAERLRFDYGVEMVRFRWVDPTNDIETWVELPQDQWVDLCVNIDPDIRFGD